MQVSPVIDVNGLDFQAALDAFASGSSLAWDGLTAVLLGDATVSVAIESTFSPVNVSEERARRDLGTARSRFGALVKRSEVFQRLIGERRIVYEITAAEYKRVIVIARLNEKTFCWAPGFPRN